MTWFYNSYSGEIENESPPSAIYFALEAELHLGTGWHDYPTQAAVLAAVKANGWPAPTTNLGKNLSNDASQGAKKAASAATSAIGAGWNLTLGNTSGLLVRILKVGVGLVLLIAGALKISGAGKTLQQVVPIVGGPAGRLLKA